MPTNLTGSTIAATYDQLLHVDGGPEATLKTVYSGDGTATGLKIGVSSAGVGNISLSGNIISTTNTNGDLSLTPNGTGSVAIGKVAITGGTINGATIGGTTRAAGNFTTLNANGNVVLGDATSDTITATARFASDLVPSANNARDLGTSALKWRNLWIDGTATMGLVNVDNIRIDANTISSTNNNGAINLTPNGSGVVSISNVAITAGTVPFNTITNRAYASFYDAGTTDQTGSTTDRTAVKWATAAVAGAGITIASNSRITLAAAGTYRINASLQFSNSTSNDRAVVVWFAKNGTNIANTGAKTVIPKTGDGGTMLVAYEIFDVVAANDYIEMYWYPENVGVTLHYVAAVAEVSGVTPAIPATPPAIVVVERIA
jgi:hypothetical protein